MEERIGKCFHDQMREIRQDIVGIYVEILLGEDRNKKKSEKEKRRGQCGTGHHTNSSHRLI